MYQVLNITADPNQTFDLLLPDSSQSFKLTMRYKARLDSWYMDLVYQDFSIYSRRVCSLPNLLQQWRKVLPFGLGCYTLDGTDPFFLEDFSNGRCGLMVLSQTDLDNLESYLSLVKDETQ